MAWGEAVKQGLTVIGKNAGKAASASGAVKNPGIKGALSGAGTGASIGATVGSIFPGIGTAIGAGVGAVVGGIAGFFSKKKKKNKKPKAGDVAEAESLNNTSKPAEENLLQKTDVGSTVIKSLLGSLFAGLISYVLKDVTAGDKKLNFSAPVFGKEVINDTEIGVSRSIFNESTMTQRNTPNPFVTMRI